MKQADKSKILEMAKITPHSKKPRAIDGDSNETESVMNSDDVSDVVNIPLTLKRNSSNDANFSTKDAIFGHTEDVIFYNNDCEDVIFNSIDEDVICTNNNDLFEDAAADTTPNQHKYKRIIPSLKTRLATDTPLKDTISLQQETRVIKSNQHVPIFTTNLD